MTASTESANPSGASARQDTASTSTRQSMFGYCAACLWVLVNFVNANFSQIVSRAYGSIFEVVLLVACVLCGGIAFAAATSFVRRGLTARVSATLTVVVYLAFPVYSLIRHLYFEPFFLFTLGLSPIRVAGAVTIAGVPVAWFATRSAAFRRAVATTSTIALLIVTSVAATHIFGAWLRNSGSSTLPDNSNSIEQSRSSTRYNVYYVIVDGYTRSDVLQKLYDVDNSPFLRAMQNRGFYVASMARSNYTTTHVALMSILEMKYLVDERSPRYSTRAAFYPAALNRGVVPQALRIYRSLGYSNIRISNRFGGCQERVFSRCFIGTAQDPWLSLSYALKVFLSDTPFSALLNYLQNFETGAHDAALYKLSILGPGNRPLFVFAHEMNPHDALSAASAKMTSYAPLAEDIKRRYQDVISSVNLDILSATDSVIAHDKNAIIVFQGDHGMLLDFDWTVSLSRMRKQSLDERTAILNLIRLPSSCQKYLYPAIGNINTMRAVVGCVQGTRPTFLDERSYVVLYENNPDFGRSMRVVFDQ